MRVNFTQVLRRPSELAELIRSWPRSLALIDYFRAPTADRVSPGSATIEESPHEATDVLCNFSGDRLACLRAGPTGFRWNLEKRSGHSDDDAQASARWQSDRHD